MASDTFDIFRALVARVRCKPNWRFRVIDEDGALRLRITVEHGPNARLPDQRITIHHFFPLPIATYNEASWRRWIFDQCLGVETHEIGEFFMDGDERPFAPLHGPGENPYVVHELRPEIDARTTQDGSVTPHPTEDKPN